MEREQERKSTERGKRGDDMQQLWGLSARNPGEREGGRERGGMRGRGGWEIQRTWGSTTEVGEKKYLKLLHNDFIHGGEHFQIEQELTLASTATQNIWKTEIPTIESKYPKCAQMCAKVCNQPQTTKQTGDTRMAHRTSHLVEAWNHGD